MIDYKSEILRLKKEKNAVVLAHYYQNDDIQDVADFLGDSLKLSQVAVDTTADIIIFCGVHFMAETAKILNPNKRVFIPRMDAGCKMADMIEPLALKKYKDEHPNTKIITYVNSTAAVKALSDCICTSTNGMKIIEHYINEGNEILYCPDQNLGKYAMEKLGVKFDVWPGCCPIHHFLDKKKIEALIEKNKDALFICHPECQPEICNIADYVGSTKQMIEFTKTNPAKKFIVGTEKGVIYAMKKASPDKEFILAQSSLSCSNMKKTSIEDLYNTLNELPAKNEIFVDDEVRDGALKSLNKMLELSK